MTRINLIKPQYLLDQHLMAEYRETPMVMASLVRSLDSPNWYKVKLPNKYTLNKGHVTFFYNKRAFLEQRWNLLIKELQRRHVNINPDERNVDFTVFDSVPDRNAWQPTKDDVAVNIQRILLRVSERPNWYRYKGRVVSYNWYKEQLQKRGIIR